MKYSIDEIKTEYLKGKKSRYSETKNTDIKEFIEEQIKLPISHKEKVYCYIHNVVPKCKCEGCTNIPKFNNFTLGFKETCSVSCSVKVNYLKQQKSKVENIQEQTKDMSVTEIVQGLYEGTLKIQGWRHIKKLKDYFDYDSLEQVYNSVILKENQRCQYCNKVLIVNRKTKELRKCTCTTKEQRYVIDSLKNNVFDLDKFIELNLHNNEDKLTKELYYKHYKKLDFTNSISENIYCLEYNITSRPKREFINLKLGYKKEEIVIDFDNNTFFENITKLKEKYSDKGLFGAIETKEYCKQFPGRNVIETIFLQEYNMSDIPKCKNGSCNKPRKFIQHSRRYSDYCEDCYNDKSINTNGVSTGEQEVLKYIKSIYSGTILTNDRSLGFEMDIYLPELKIGIEYNGVHWHSSKFKTPDYHLNKTEKCEENDIHLIHIFSTEWTDKQDIVKSIIKSKLGMITNVLYAEDTEIKEVSLEESDLFLENNNIKGTHNSPIRYGLYYNNELVQLMTIKRSHRSKAKYLELKRFASKLEYNIIGGFNKLLKHVKTVLNNETIITFADRRYSVKENVYFKNGKFLGKTPINYFYITNNGLESREQYQKHKLKDKLTDFDESLTEKENIHRHDIFEIYDCGNFKYEL